jgi:hypothetical protein
MDSAQPCYNGKILCCARYDSSLSKSYAAVDTQGLLGPAVIKQLGTSGVALSIIAMSWCIFHDHIIDIQQPLDSRHGYFGVIVICLIQAGNIAIPNIKFHGAYHYYGIAG